MKQSVILTEHMRKVPLDWIHLVLSVKSKTILHFTANLKILPNDLEHWIFFTVSVISDKDKLL